MIRENEGCLFELNYRTKSTPIILPQLPRKESSESRVGLLSSDDPVKVSILIQKDN